MQRQQRGREKHINSDKEKGREREKEKNRERETHRERLLSVNFKSCFQNKLDSCVIMTYIEV